MEHGAHHSPKRSFITSPAGIAFIVLAVIGAYFLWSAHRAHIAMVIPYLSLLALLACPLLHFFMHGRHGGHGGHHGVEPGSPDDRPPT